MSEHLLTDAQLNAVETIVPPAILDLERNRSGQGRNIDPRFTQAARDAELERLTEATNALQDSELSRLAEEIDREKDEALRAIDAEHANARATLPVAEETRLARESTDALAAILVIQSAGRDDIDTVRDLFTEALASQRPGLIQRVAEPALNRLKALAIAETQDANAGLSGKAQCAWADLDPKYRAWQREASATSPAARRQRELDRATRRKADVARSLQQLRALRRGAATIDGV